ncbi:unnamed protein product [Mycetohabitans rhizoxinica HKI 454]|uniref:DUF3318 domain-containing protein n=1 Tax=Mycetohabitans rhizoxinica (strain DSM 19002 / CIP 109453 / HKI 454) TaxID=882378 RepID=E5ASG4_MYCRK|nr:MULTISPECIES: DUF3318 domain-containing protein [Mycetohabitans]MCG1047509.1 DUF3318 domain-containing protein [Mycetohabitans sp. B6]CBW75546.1 unnamed protein product [Mycetohabitans rhizoxinica HKI 454]
MNHPYSNSRLAQPASVRGSGDPKVRAIRKELLLARADLDRLDIAQAGQELRQGVTKFSWLGRLMPGISRFRSLRRLPAIGALLGQHPVLGSIASAAFSGPVRRMVMRNAKPLLKWTVVGTIAWRGYKLWKAVRPQRSMPAAAARHTGPTAHSRDAHRDA